MNDDNGSDSDSDKGEAETEKTESKGEADEDAVDTSDINAEVVRMPKMSDTIEEGVISAWHKKLAIR